MSHQGSTGNVIAALASFFIPGLGQLIQGRVLAALFWFLWLVLWYALGAMLIIPLIGTLIFHIWCIVNAARWTPAT